MCVLVLKSNIDRYKFVRRFSHLLEMQINDSLIAPIACAAVVLLGTYLYFHKRPMSSPRIIHVDKKEFTMSEVASFNGKTHKEDPILTVIDGLVYDLQKGREFYGEGGPYNPFAGRDSTRLLAKNQVSDKTDTLEPLNETELEQLEKWKEFFNNKYGSIGKLVT